jgi:Lrp/AsnC ligand binding domain
MGLWRTTKTIRCRCRTGRECRPLELLPGSGLTRTWSRCCGWWRSRVAGVRAGGAEVSARWLRLAPDPAVTARPAAVAAADAVQAVIRIRLAPAASRRGFEEYLRALPSVRCAWQVTGDADYELLVVCPAVAGLGSVLACLRRCGGIEVASAGLALREFPVLARRVWPVSWPAGGESRPWRR